MNEIKLALEAVVKLPCIPIVIDPIKLSEAIRLCKTALESLDVEKREPVAWPWKPIKTAPRDGTNILLRFGIDHVSQGMYVPGLPHPWKFIDSQNGVSWLINNAIDGAGGPSQWMPLPSPAPEAQDNRIAELEAKLEQTQSELDALNCLLAVPSNAQEPGHLSQMWHDLKAVLDKYETVPVQSTAPVREVVAHLKGLVSSVQGVIADMPDCAERKALIKLIPLFDKHLLELCDQQKEKE